MTDGVTVALQFLELSVQVRILVGQQKEVRKAQLTQRKNNEILPEWRDFVV
jgi:hypothetical protein